jgi:tetratricopeptide (TPR) repeat protein
MEPMGNARRAVHTTRRRIAAAAVVFTCVVSASFAYGLMLLWRGPSRPRAGAPGRLAPLPPDVVAVLERSAEQMKKGEVEQAVLGYRRVLTLGPSLEALLGLAEGEWRAGRLDEAVREYERVLSLDPGQALALARAARVHAGRRETWPQAETRYREYLAQAPGDAEAWLALGRLLAWRGNAEGAVAIYARDDVRPLLTAEDRRSQALALVQLGRGQEAEPMLGRLSRSNPADVDVSLTLGGLHASRSEWQQALPLYRNALERRPDDVRANLDYGQGLLAIGDPAAALAPLEKAVLGLPGSAEAGTAYARALRGAGELERADAEFERVTRLVDASAEVEREYADLLMERKRYSRAAGYYQRALGRGLRDERLLVGLASALDAAGKPSEALPHLEDAYALGRDQRVGFELARLYKRLGRNERALQILGEIESAPPSP